MKLGAFSFSLNVKGIIVYLILLMLLMSCTNSGNTKEQQSNKHPEQEHIDNDVNLTENDTLDEFTSEIVTYWIVIADSSRSYPYLFDKMQSASSELNIEIDTMGKIYDEKKNLIKLPDDDYDDMYAGHYYPRRYLSESLSIEYCDCYSGVESEIMVIVAGICETKSKADSIVADIGHFFGNAFTIESNIFIGCVH